MYAVFDAKTKKRLPGVPSHRLIAEGDTPTKAVMVDNNIWRVPDQNVEEDAERRGLALAPRLVYVREVPQSSTTVVW